LRKIPRIGIGQLLLLLVWISLSFGLTYEVTHFQSKLRGINEIAISADGKAFAIAARSGTRIYKNSRCIASLPRSTKNGVGIRFVDDSSVALILPRSEDIENGIHFFSLQSKSVERCFPLDARNERAFLLKDKIVVQKFGAVGQYQFLLYGIDAVAGDKPASTFASPHVNAGTSLSSDGRFAAFYWTNADQERLELMQKLQNSVYVLYDIFAEEVLDGLPTANFINFSPDDSFVIVCDDKISRYDWPTKELDWSIDYFLYTDIRFSRDGSKFAVRKLDSNQLIVLESETGVELRQIALHDESGLGFEFSIDGQAVWVPDHTESGGIRKVSIASGLTVGRLGNANSYYRWIVYYVLFVGWSFLYAMLFCPNVVRSWFAFCCVWPGGILLTFFAITNFFSDVPRALRYDAYESFYSALFKNYLMLAITSFMLVNGFRCCPWLKRKRVEPVVPENGE
jgi:hypothetical protein